MVKVADQQPEPNSSNPTHLNESGADQPSYDASRSWHSGVADIEAGKPADPARGATDNEGVPAKSPDDTERAVEGLLGPKFDPGKHQLYVDRLKHLIESRQARNIAVAGQYGSGKNSVLEGLVTALAETELEPMTISMSTIDAGAASQRDDSGGVQAERSETASEGSARAAIPHSPTTSLIQREIVKQLVYRERPRDVRRSRFRRIEKPSVGRTVAWAALTALVAFVVVFAPSAGLALRAVLAMATAASLAFVAQWSFGGQVILQQLRAGPATLSLETNKSYFDEYLDEIVYFFDVSGCRVVIFEDLDRFNDPHIFESLLELNKLLNAAKQLKREKRGPIRFVYATKDSIFEINNAPSPDTPGGPDSPAADRAKFFDAIVPIVPFVTHRTSRDHFSQLLASSGVSSRAVGIVAKHVTDMRLIANICNELNIFETVVRNGGPANLSTDSLFAMVAYKNLHLGDFEKITSGQSQLDEVRRRYRRIINETAAELERRLSELRATPTQSTSVQEHLQQSATRLRDFIDDIHRSSSTTITVGSDSYGLDDLDKPGFWEAVGASDHDPMVRVPGVQPLTIRRRAVERAFGTDLPQTTVEQVLRPQVDDELHQVERDHRDVLRARIADLFSRTDLVLNGAPCDFAQEIDALNLSGLTVELLRAELLDAHFAFYVADYPAFTMSPAAAEYEMTVIERFGFDARFELSQATTDVPALIESSGEAFFGDRRGYNIDIVNYLCSQMMGEESNSKEDSARRLKDLVTALAEGGDDEIEFVNAYLSAEDQPDRPEKGRFRNLFLQMLAGKWGSIFTYLGNQVSDADTERARLNAALHGASVDINYRHDEAAAALLERNAAQTAAFTEAGVADLGSLIHVASLLHARLPDVVPFDATIRAAVIGANLYEVNAGNLRALASDSSSGLPALDELLVIDGGAGIVEHVVVNLSDYVNVLKAEGEQKAQVVATSEHYRAIVDSIASSPTFSDLNQEDATLLFDRAPGNAEIDSLEQIPSAAWPALVAAKRCHATVKNLVTFLDNGEDPEVWAGQLGRCEGLTLTEEDDQDARQRAAVAVLAMDRLDAARRVRIVKKLGLKGPLPVSALSPAALPLLPELTKAGLTSDSATTFNAIPANQSEVRGRYIDQSTEIVTFLDEVTLTDSEVLAILNSIDPDKEPLGLPFESLLAFAGRMHGLQLGPFIAVLARELKSLGPREIREVLDAMPYPYNSLGREVVTLPDSNSDKGLADVLHTKGINGKRVKVRNKPVIRVTAS